MNFQPNLKCKIQKLLKMLWNGRYIRANIFNTYTLNIVHCTFNSIHFILIQNIQYDYRQLLNNFFSATIV